MFNLGFLFNQKAFHGFSLKKSPINNHALNAAFPNRSQFLSQSYSPSKRCLLCLFREPKPRSIFLSPGKQTLNVDSYCFISFAFTYYLLHVMWIPGSNAPAVTLTLKCLYSFFLLHCSKPYLVQKQEVLFTNHKGHEINTDASKFVG